MPSRSDSNDLFCPADTNGGLRPKDNSHDCPARAAHTHSSRRRTTPSARQANAGMSEAVKVCATARASQSSGPAFSVVDWNTISIDALYRALNNPRATPQTTVEAIMLAVRERGLAALEEAANVECWVRCDQVARRQINKRITSRAHADEGGSRSCRRGVGAS